MSTPDIQGEGFPATMWQHVVPRVESALANLDLAGHFSAVRIAADDLPGDDEAWYRVLPGLSGAQLPVLVVSCHPDSFCRHRPLRTTEYPPRAVWEQFAAPRDDEDTAPLEFDIARADAFLHHHLLTVRDMVEGEVTADEIPVRLAESFGAAWAVTVDGRLDRAGWPGFSVTERRGRFSRLFSSAGIMLPEHWQIFQTLWDGGLSSRRDVLGIARQLPRL